jgi:hypothetical protein
MKYAQLGHDIPLVYSGPSPLSLEPFEEFLFLMFDALEYPFPPVQDDRSISGCRSLLDQLIGVPSVCDLCYQRREMLIAQ